MARYTREQRAYAKEKNLHLVTIDALGVEFTGPVSKPIARRLLKWCTTNILSKPPADVDETVPPENPQ